MEEIEQLVMEKCERKIEKRAFSKTNGNFSALPVY